MTDELVLKNLKLIRGLYKEHDWYYDYADDMKVWSAGLAEREEIIKLIASLPQKDRNLILKEAQSDQIETLKFQVEKVLKPIAVS